jgi:hypothetical protein
MSEKKATFSDAIRLPDGSGCFIGSFPLPKDHWLYAEHENVPPMSFKIGLSDERDRLRAHVIESARYAIRASTMNGKIEDFDPDAMVQNFVIGMLGYFTPTGDENSPSRAWEDT